MLGLCNLLMDFSGKVTVDTTLESAVLSYHDCKLPLCSWFATRAILFYFELFKFHQQWKSSPVALIRLVSEDMDVRNALLLEQAASCFLKTTPPMIKKYGFHSILAGHRFNKCGQVRLGNLIDSKFPILFQNCSLLLLPCGSVFFIHLSSVTMLTEVTFPCLPFILPRDGPSQRITFISLSLDSPFICPTCRRP